jgi:hypothetical protein
MTSGERFRQRLIANWRAAHKFWSVRISALGAAMSAAWVALPADTRAAIPGAQWIGLVLFAAVVISRLIDQEKPHA